jgi:hypothetical protein
VNYRMLKGLMLMNGDTAQDLADALKIHRSTLSSKMHESGTAFTKEEMTAIKDRYKLDAKQFYEIFFDYEVSKKDTKEAVKA